MPYHTLTTIVIGNYSDSCSKIYILCAFRHQLHYYHDCYHVNVEMHVSLYRIMIYCLFYFVHRS